MMAPSPNSFWTLAIASSSALVFGFSSMMVRPLRWVELNPCESFYCSAVQMSTPSDELGHSLAPARRIGNETNFSTNAFGPATSFIHYQAQLLGQFRPPSGWAPWTNQSSKMRRWASVSGSTGGMTERFVVSGINPLSTAVCIFCQTRVEEAAVG